MLLAKYRDFLPVTPATPLLSLGEGGTPLIPVPALAAFAGVRELHVKFDGMNPTGSFKDRGMVMAVAKAAEDGAKVVLCASTGNTSAAAAAYARRAGLRAVVAVPAGKISAAKLAQTLMYGATLLPIQGDFDHAMEMVRMVAKERPLALVNSVNPHRLEGQATGAYEVCEVLGDAPDGVALPVGNAGNICAYWMGFQRWQAAGRSTKLPRMYGFEAEGCAAIVRGEVIKNPHTVASAIRVGNPASWKKAEAARDASRGRIDFVSDPQILEAWRALAHEGIFCEPASAAGVAGLKKLAAAGQVERNGRFVAVVTGHGLKDSAIAAEGKTIPEAVAPEMDAVLAWLDKHVLA